VTASDTLNRRLSLDEHFTAPEGHTACFGWVIGFSADEVFLDLALERFTGRSRIQREHEARTFIAVVLDPTRPAIEPIDCPGVVHLHMKPPLPFRLLHAKVAVLAFRGPSGQWRLRLIVSTGNWTTESLASSIDLAWSVEVPWSPGANASSSLTAEEREDAADIRAAWDLVNFVLGLTDASYLAARSPVAVRSDTATAYRAAVQCLERLSPRPAGRTRFFDTRRSSALTEILKRVPFPSRRRNYFAVGSGFYEGPSAAVDAVPSVIAALSSRLAAMGVLSGTARKALYVNPGACQGVATAATALNETGWVVSTPVGYPQADLLPSSCSVPTSEMTRDAARARGCTWDRPT